MQPRFKLLRKGPLKCYYGAKKREKYKFPGSFADISLSQHLGRVLASIHHSQSRAEWIFGQMRCPCAFLILCTRAGFMGEHVAGKLLLVSSPLSLGHGLPSQTLHSCHCPFAVTFFFQPRRAPGTFPTLFPA